MSFFDVIDFLANISLLGKSKSSRERPKILVVFNFLGFLGICWSVFELSSIFNLLSPVVFTGVSIAVGVILGFVLLILLYKLEIIGYLSRKDLFQMLIPVILLTVPISSFVNRHGASNGVNFQGL